MNNGSGMDTNWKDGGINSVSSVDSTVGSSCITSSINVASQCDIISSFSASSLSASSNLSCSYMTSAAYATSCPNKCKGTLYNGDYDISSVPMTSSSESSIKKTSYTFHRSTFPYFSAPLNSLTHSTYCFSDRISKTSTVPFNDYNKFENVYISNINSTSSDIPASSPSQSNPLGSQSISCMNNPASIILHQQHCVNQQREIMGVVGNGNSCNDGILDNRRQCSTIIGPSTIPALCYNIGPYDMRYAQMYIHAEFQRLRQDLLALHMQQNMHNLQLHESRSNAQPIIIQNETKINALASVDCNKEDDNIEDRKSALSLWIDSLLNSRVNQLILLSFLGIGCYMLSEHYRHTWRIAQLQRRVDSNILLRCVRMIEDMVGVKK